MLRVTALASGSSGNAMLITTPRAKILIDAGLSARAIERSLRLSGVAANELDAIFLTHEHSDHVLGAGSFSRRNRVTVVANQGTLRAAMLDRACAEELATGDTTRIGDLTIGSFPLPHDSREPVGYWVKHDTHHVCLATDLGHVPSHLREHIRCADLVVLEANHDRRMLLEGRYPIALKRRVDSPLGHLSNVQAAECIVASASGRPQWLWLAHLSAENNNPTLALRTVNSTLASAGVHSVSVAVALRDRRSLEWDSDGTLVQLRMALH